MTKTRASARAAKRRTTFRRTTKPNDPRYRVIALLVFFVVLGASFIAVLVDLQAVRPDNYRSLSEEQRTRTRQIAGYRGAVTDRNGFVLAASTPSHQIVADPQMVESPADTAALLAPILGIEVTTLTAALEPSSPNDQYSLLARNIDDEAVRRIQQLETTRDDDPLLGIFVRPEEDRVYPAGELATAVVGRVDPDEQGIFGVEERYDSEMTGIPGTERFERGRFGSISVGDWKVDPATAGHDVVLTLDNRIQYVAEQTLIDHCNATGAEGATAIVSDPRTGDILAMAGAARHEEDGCVVARYNPGVVTAFEPGSVMKPLVISAAIEELGYTADTVIEVPKRLSVGGKTFVDHPPHPAAPFPISDVLAKSMNVGTILLSQRIPTETLYGYYQGFGIGQPTGLDIEGETSGNLRHPDDWWGADYGSIPIGQGMTVNAAQLLAAYNVFASGGTYQPLRLVHSLEAPDGVTYEPARVEPRTVLSERSAGEISRSLAAVVERGTGRKAAVDGLAVAGKTGTAWKVFDDGSGQLGYGSPGNRRYVVSFVGYLPADDPQLSMVIVVDEPEGLATAALIAAPMFAEIGDYAASILGIAPSGAAPAVSDGRVRAEPAASPLAAVAAADGGGEDR